MIIIRPRKYTLWERVYLFEVARGLMVTGRHFIKNVWGALIHDRVIKTYEYPEEPMVYSQRARNVHRLTHREDGSPRCVACLMCETVCPAQCISIVAKDITDDKPGVEKQCASFVIDELRCIYCGFCVEACPKDAIRMDTSQATLTQYNREEFIFDRETLLGHERRKDIDEGEQ